ncbi:MAG: TRAP transporter small permease subunit [Candidatus Sedimenticola sp. 6PFRAG7]
MQKLLRLSELIDGLNERVGRSLSWLVLIMVVLGVYNAVTRKLSQTIGMDLSSNMYIEAQWYMFSIVFLWGGAYTLKHRGHVRVDILYSRVKLKVKAWIDILGTVLFLMPLSLLIIWVSIPYAADSWSILEISPDPGGLPRYIIKTVIPVAFVLVLAQGISELIKNVAYLKGLIPHQDEEQQQGPEL